MGFIGYPNTGKSSIINTLRREKVCSVAPIPGQTKVWQYITLMRRIFLIDCPGIVPPSTTDTETDIILRGVVRVETVAAPDGHIEELLRRCKPIHLSRTYQVKDWTSELDFLEKVAIRRGRLLKGAKPDIESAARMVISDFVRGKLPWYVPDPHWPVEPPSKKQKELDDALTKGALGEQRVFLHAELKSTEQEIST